MIMSTSSDELIMKTSSPSLRLVRFITVLMMPIIPLISAFYSRLSFFPNGVEFVHAFKPESTVNMPDCPWRISACYLSGLLV